MKTLKITYITFFFLSVIYSASAQNSSSEIVVSGTKFTYPLVEKWISEYVALHPDVNLKIAPKTGTEPVDIKVIAHNPSDKELEGDRKLFWVSRYAILPVTNKSNPLVKNAEKKTLSKKDLSKLFFEEDIFADNKTKQNKGDISLNVYTREGQACSTIAFAGYFGHKPTELKGKKISGDDIYLLSAIQKDSLGITFNNLAYLYDIKTRKLKPGISVLPIELKKETANILNSDIDKTIQLLENNTFETIPVEKVGFVINTNDATDQLKGFLQWVVTDGQKYNHEYGFLSLDNETLSNQLVNLKNNYLSARY